MSADHSRDPCPYVILNDFGGAFAMGALGGTIWHGIKGARNSPRGERLPGSLAAIKARAPVLGGNFGVWGGMFSSFDCAVKGVRQKEDSWNAIISGFFTGGCLAIRGEQLLWWNATHHIANITKVVQKLLSVVLSDVVSCLVFSKASVC